MNSINIIKWIRVIAIWSLLCTILGVVLYTLLYFKIIEEPLTTSDHFDFAISTIANLIIFIGLWRLTSWGWKFTIIFSLISWTYFIFDSFINYERFTGVVIAPFIILEAVILRYLLTADVQKFFNISSEYFNRLLWTPTAYFLLALFFVVMDFFDGLIALVTVIAMLLGLRVSRKHMKDLKSRESNKPLERDAKDLPPDKGD